MTKEQLIGILVALMVGILLVVVLSHTQSSPLRPSDCELEIKR